MAKRGPQKLKVFISYSRQDIAFVDRLQQTLATHSIDAFVDRDHIEKSEEWWARIKQLITDADTIVFVLSANSVDSKVCNDEVAFGEKLHKRFVPIVARDLEGREVPAALARLNYVFFIPNPTAGASGDFDAAVADLVRALETDIPWIREHTRLGGQAERWESRKRPGDLLLRGAELNAAERWLTTRPDKAPDPTDTHRALVTLSRQAATRRQRTLVGVSLAAVVVASALAGTAFWQRGEAANQRAAALLNQSRSVAERAQRSLDDNNYAVAIRLALAVLPEVDGLRFGADRPYSADAERILHYAMTNLSRKYIHREIVDDQVKRTAHASSDQLFVHFNSGRLLHFIRSEAHWNKLVYERIHTFAPDESSHAFSVITLDGDLSTASNGSLIPIRNLTPVLLLKHQIAIGRTHIATTRCDSQIKIDPIRAAHEPHGPTQASHNSAGTSALNISLVGSVPIGACPNLEFDASGRFLLVSSAEIGLIRYDLAQADRLLKPAGRFVVGRGMGANRVAHAFPSNLGAIGLQNNDVAVVRTNVIDPESQCVMRNAPSPVSSLAMSTDGRRIVVGLESGEIQLWMADTCIKTATRRLTPNQITRFEFSSSSSDIVAIDSVGNSFVVRGDTLETILSVAAGVLPVVHATPGQSIEGVVLVRVNGDIELWTVNNREQVAFHEGITDVLTCSDGTIVTASDPNKTLPVERIYDSSHMNFWEGVEAELGRKTDLFDWERSMRRATGEPEPPYRTERAAPLGDTQEVKYWNSGISEARTVRTHDDPCEGKGGALLKSPAFETYKTEGRWHPIVVGAKVIGPAGQHLIEVINKQTNDVIGHYKQPDDVLSVAVTPSENTILVAEQKGAVISRPFFPNSVKMLRDARETFSYCLTNQELNLNFIDETSIECTKSKSANEGTP